MLAVLVTTVTHTLYAQNFPSLTIMTSVIGLMVFLGLVPGTLVSVFGEEAPGDVVVSLWLFGSFLGALLGGLSSTVDIISAGYVPWGLTVFLAIALVVWQIKGGGH